MKQDEGILSDFKLQFEDLPLLKRRKKKLQTTKGNTQPSVLGNSMDTRYRNYTTANRSSDRPEDSRPISNHRVRTLVVNGRKVLVFPPGFFHH